MASNSKWSSMEKYLVVELDSCWICRSADATQDIFTDRLDGEKVFLYQALECISGIKLNTDDSLNKSLCMLCCRRLLDAFKFKTQVLETFFTLYEPYFKEDASIDEDEIEVLAMKSEDEGTTSTSQDYQAPSKNAKLMEVDMSTDAVSFLLAYQSNHTKKHELQEPKDDTRSIKSKKTTRSEKHKVVNQCQVCGRLFPKKSNLIDHLRLHADQKNFSCSFCGKSFVQIANYRTHLRIHTNERPFKCSICEKTFIQSTTMKVHVRSHTQERNYLCLVCNKAFTTSSDLNKHKRVHDSSQKLKCEYCDKLFAQKVNLQTHQKRHHSTKELNKNAGVKCTNNI